MPHFKQPSFVHEKSVLEDAIKDIHQVETDVSIPETQRMQLAKARVGQGLFCKPVVLIEPSCRVTGVNDPRLLIASHIKPWRDSSNFERISGHNGIMLARHVDALFDDQLMTLRTTVHVHASLPREVLERWSIETDQWVAPFMPEQHEFLAHRREMTLQRQLSNKPFPNQPSTEKSQAFSGSLPLNLIHLKPSSPPSA